MEKLPYPNAPRPWKRGKERRAVRVFGLVLHVFCTCFDCGPILHCRIESTNALHMEQAVVVPAETLAQR